MSGGIVALDLSTHVGFAIAPTAVVERWPEARPGALGSGGAVWPQPVSGTFHLPQFEDRGRRFRAYHQWLAEILAGVRPTTLYAEAPLFHGCHSGNEAARLAFGLMAITEAAIPDSSVRLFKEVHNGTLKKHFTGTGKAEKKHMIQACLERGWNPGDDNEADALALLDYAIFDTWFSDAEKRKRAARAAA